ncbi:MAG: hypothetical protein ACRYGP_33415 [Janthinobacterium lividum]
MTDLTRRDALLLAAAATMAPALAGAAEAAPVQPVLVLGDGVQDGGSIPIGLKVPPGFLKVAPPTPPGDLSITFYFADETGGNAVDIMTVNVKAGMLASGVDVATRLRILVDPKTKAELKQTGDAAGTTIGARLAFNGTSTPISKVVRIRKGDCPPTDSSTLRFSAQPSFVASNGLITLKSLVPQPLPAKPDKRPRLDKVEITCLADPTKPAGETQAVSIDKIADNYLSDEVYTAFAFVLPKTPVVVKSSWTYKGGVTLVASLYVSDTA